MIQTERILALNQQPPREGKYVLYWMQASQRVHFNHALEYAVERANELKLPLLVGFGLMADYPEANLRHYHFMLEGLRETQEKLIQRGIKLVIRRGRPDEVALELAGDAALVVCDRGYLIHQKRWRDNVADRASCPVTQVEADVVVPVELASDHTEFAARTLRPKILKHLPEYLIDLSETTLQRDSLGLRSAGLKLDNLGKLLKNMNLDESVPPATLLRGGTAAGQAVLRNFIDYELANYHINRNRPETDSVSYMSRYLHFGQLSPVWIALQVRDSKKGSAADRDAYLEELIVRRELSYNYCHFTPRYDRYESLPVWCRQTLARHRTDRRPVRYRPAQLEACRTGDPYWNAAMREMIATGYMHNYMRMYWGKKIIEWSPTPERAWRVALYLNNKYFLDGRDPVSYANIAWLFGRHDRPWKERPIFGTIRYMSAEGLRRKADPEAYIEKIRRLETGDIAGRGNSLAR